MSTYSRIEVQCDVCEEYFLEEIEDIADVYQAIQDTGGGNDILINGNDYEHMCQDCYNEVNYCEVCDESKWNDEVWTCNDWVMCDECVEDQHEKLLADGECEEVEGCCDLCDWEFPTPAKDQTREALVLL